jgi:hypothetical protein
VHVKGLRRPEVRLLDLEFELVALTQNSLVRGVLSLLRLIALFVKPLITIEGLLKNRVIAN